MIQGRDPKGNGKGRSGYSRKGKFSSNGSENLLKHTVGVVSMARTSKKNSAGSQFFTMDSDSPHIDREYAAFGKVAESMDIVEIIAKVKVDSNDKPLTLQIIKTLSIKYPALIKF